MDNILDHCVLVIVPTSNPDGRVTGIRGNSAVADTNRDYFLQSQPEEKIDAALQQEFLATGALHLHGYVTPTLDRRSDTMPHNPGLQYDIFSKWNTKRDGTTRTTSTPWATRCSAPSMTGTPAAARSRTYTISAAHLRGHHGDHHHQLQREPDQRPAPRSRSSVSQKPATTASTPW